MNMKLQVSKCLSDSNGDAWRDELEYYKNRKLSGKQKHNAKWMAIYNDFVAGYESGMTMIEIARRNNVSERTIYRYKAYYDKMRKVEVDE